METVTKERTKISEPQIDVTDKDVVEDPNYVRRSSELIHESLQKGSDVIQMSNGDILVNEVKTVTYRYQWNQDKGKFERASTGSRMKRHRKMVENNDN